MFGNETASTYGTFDIEGNSITYETIVGGGEDGTTAAASLHRPAS